MYRHHKLYIKATETKFSFTTQNYGILGCQSDSSRLVDEKNRIFQKDLHTQYFLSIGNLYVSMYKNLDLYVNYITEAVHQFSTESASVPSSLLDDSSIVSGIVRLIPTRIPNLNMPKLKYLEFDKFFKSQLNKSEDDLIAQFSNREFLERFGTRQLKMIYSAAEQFYSNCRTRVVLDRKVVRLPVKTTTPLSVIPVGDEGSFETANLQYIDNAAPVEPPPSASADSPAATDVNSQAIRPNSGLASPGPNIPLPDRETFRQIELMKARGQWVPAEATVAGSPQLSTEGPKA